ncbi:MAG: EAL domain-containing protein [Firmicutes bacterium]|nr:EAL domain-containing protein [Bacillota bacterium]
MHSFLEQNIVPHFQPIICIDNGSIFGYELLGRLLNPLGPQSLGPFFHDSHVSPDDKISVDRVIRRKALEKVSDNNCRESLFINIQPQWLYPFLNNGRRYPTLEYLKEYGLDPGKITIEICEADFSLDLTTLNELIYRYKDAGCRIAIDDLGKGFSNLDRIIHLNPDYLKIDAGITRNSPDNELPFIVMETLGLLSQKMGVNLVLEGVETREQFQQGLRAGVRYFQGYFFAHPSSCFLRPDSFTRLIEAELNQYHRSEVCCRENLANFCAQLEARVKKVPFSPDLIEYVYALMKTATSDWNKIYICDFQGFQQTPNYMQRTPGSWEIHEEYLSRNWCWRPYFLPYVTDSIRYRRGVLSAPYNDLETQYKIWTFVYPLKNNFFLFIDCKYN